MFETTARPLRQFASVHVMVLDIYDSSGIKKECYAHVALVDNLGPLKARIKP